MKDFTGRTINIGDDVIFYCKAYKSMQVGKVYNIGEKMVCVQFNFEIGDIIKPKVYKVYPTHCIVFSSEVVDESGKVTRIDRIL